MFSNLVKANYEIKDVSLLSLRNRIIQENNLTSLDILKGFHEKSKIDLRYEITLTEQMIKDCQDIEEEYKRYFLTEGKKNIQGMYEEEFNSLFEICKKDYPNTTLTDIFECRKDESNFSISTQNASDSFFRSLRRMGDKLKNKLTHAAKDHIRLYIKEKFGEKYKIDTNHTFHGIEGLPYELETNTPIDIDFSKVYKSYKSHSGDLKDWITLSYESHTGSTDNVRLAEFDKIEVFVLLPKSTAKEAFDNAVNAIIYQNNSIGELEFFQNLEVQPITININTKTGKYELIDGYRRLLYITDPELLKYSAPIRFFTDLNDSQFLALLYASNMWKSKQEFHDRGFLFALKTRFDFVIPSSAYGNFYRNELHTLQLYDFGDELARVDKTKIMNTLNRHKYSVSDVKLLYNFLPQEAEKPHGYDQNISEEIMLTIIELVGELRRAKDNDLQKELSEELITSIFEDDFIKKTCIKKHLSSRTYVKNYFRDKGVNKRIIEMIRDNLFTEIE